MQLQYPYTGYIYPDNNIDALTSPAQMYVLKLNNDL